LYEFPLQQVIEMKTAFVPRISIELQQLNADTFRRLSLGLVDMAMRLECTAT